MNRRRIQPIEPRLLTKDQAAEYLSFSRAAFQRHCKVTPISFGEARLLRWDREDLDAWIDAVKGRAPGDPGVMTEEQMDRAMAEWMAAEDSRERLSGRGRKRSAPKST